ncbi:MAG: hypothetical protein ACRENP_19350 [Longimicrobiales bacterium]
MSAASPGQQAQRSGECIPSRIGPAWLGAVSWFWLRPAQRVCTFTINVD